jgi:hypothetical protein
MIGQFIGLETDVYLYLLVIAWLVVLDKHAAFPVTRYSSYDLG